MCNTRVRRDRNWISECWQESRVRKCVEGWARRQGVFAAKDSCREEEEEQEEEEAKGFPEQSE